MAQAPEKRAGMAKAYVPQDVEARLYRMWMEGGYFTPKIDWSRKPFTIIMPPPNVTGELHIGQALTATIEDILTRWHRMKGDPTLWLPGVDHAAIAVQVLVEQLLAGEGLTRHDLGRERFLERVWQWVNTYRPRIMEQHKRLGASCDWSREKFTMDPGPSLAVRATFVNLYKKGLIYRGERIINWCPRCSTALSDLEVEHQEHQSFLWHVRYALVPTGAPGEAQYIEVATTRPETILGDTAVAVNPHDPRHTAKVGRQAVLPVLGRHIPIVADDAVDPQFGTGAVKITPAHDPVDFGVAQRHGLPLINILNPDATMNAEAGPYAGMDRYACREALVAELERQGLLVKTEAYVHSVGHCQRCGTAVEPWASKQWFVKTGPLAAPAILAVTDGRIKIVPAHFTKVYMNWMENIEDWCISRQLWWGHRIPVWYCDDCGEVTVAVEEPKVCTACGSSRVTQESDTLDTWFSSALWPHSTLGWPEDTGDLRYFYPTSVMETGYDILFFWVARMIMMGIENTGEIPFHTVYLHGLIRDDKGQKMSKSKGNAVDPLQTVDEYGCDAMRFALSTGSSPGNDMKLSEQRLAAGRNFGNKLWNAARFVLGLLDDKPLPQTSMASASIDDRWILSRLGELERTVDHLLTDFQLGEAGRQIHDFVWGEFCDWFIELAKIRLREGPEPSPLPVLLHVLKSSLQLLHPYMPFLTEAIWQEMLHTLPPDAMEADALIIAPYPNGADISRDEVAEEEMESVLEIIRAIRNARAEHSVEPARFIQAIAVGAPERLAAWSRHEASIKALARLASLESRPSDGQKPQQAIPLVLPGAEVYLPLAGMIDLEAQRQRLLAEIKQEEALLERIEAKLANEQFTSRAAPPVVERERERRAASLDKLARLRDQLARLG